MRDWYLIGMVTVATVLVFAAGMAAGWLSAVDRGERRRRRVEQRPVTGRVPVTRRRPVGVGPGPVEALESLPPRGPAALDATAVLADHPTRDAQLIITQALPPVQPDEAPMRAVLDSTEQLRRDVLADLHDVEGDEDDDEPGGPPSGGGGGHTGPVGTGAPIVPRYQPPTAAVRWPADRGVLPSGWMTSVGWRVRTWWVRLRAEAAALRQAEGRGWEPGEATKVLRPRRRERPRRRHAARRGGQSWADLRAGLSARWFREREEATESLRHLIYRHTAPSWSLVLPEMRSALVPPQRTVVAAWPMRGCVP